MAENGVEIQHMQFVYGIGVAEYTTTAQSPNVTDKIISVARLCCPFDGADDLPSSEKAKAPGAYALQRVPLLGRNGNHDHVVLIRQLLSEQPDPRGHRLFQEHYVILSLQEFERVESNFGNLIGQWDFHRQIPMRPQPGKQELAGVQRIRVKPAQDRLKELRDVFASDQQRLKALLATVLSEKPCAIAGFPRDESQQLALLEFLVLLLPEPLRPQLTFATRVVGPADESFRVVFTSNAPKHLVFDWQLGRLRTADASAKPSTGYAEEIVALVYEEELLQVLENRPEAGEAAQKIRNHGGPVLVTDILRDMKQEVAGRKLGSPETARVLWEAWERRTGELLDRWRIVTGKATLSVRKRWLNKGYRLEPDAWTKTLVEVFRVLNGAEGSERDQEDQALLVTELNGADETLRSKFFDPQSGFLGGIANVSGCMRGIEKLLADQTLATPIKEEILRSAASASRSASEASQLLKTMVRTNNWDATNLGAFLDSPGLNTMPEDVKRVLRDILRIADGEEPANGEHLINAYNALDQDEEFLYQACKTALDNTQLGLFDAWSLKLIAKWVTEPRWRDLLSNFWPKLLGATFPQKREREVAIWTEVAQLINAIPKEERDRHPIYKLWVRAVGTCMAWQKPMDQSAQAAAKIYAESQHAAQFFQDVLNLPCIANPEEPTVLFSNIIDLLKNIETPQSGAIPLLLCKATELAESSALEMCDTQVLLDFVEISARRPSESVETAGKWLPRAFKKAAATGENGNLLRLVQGFGDWVSACWRESREKAQTLLSYLQDGQTLEPVRQVRVYGLLLDRFEESELKKQVEILMSESLAAVADGVIQTLACSVAPKFADEQSSKDADWVRVAETLMDQLSKMSDQQLVLDALHKTDVGVFCGCLARKVSFPDQAYGFAGLLVMKEWLSSHPDLATACGALMAGWVSWLPHSRKALRVCLEEIWGNPVQRDSISNLMCGLLEQYGKNIAYTNEEDAAKMAFLWAFEALEGIQQSQAASLIEPILPLLAPETRTVCSYLVKENETLSPQGGNLLRSFEQEFYLGHPENILQYDEQKWWKLLALARVISFARRHNKLELFDSSTMNWLASLHQALQANLWKLKQNRPEIEESFSYFANECREVLRAKVKMIPSGLITASEKLSLANLAIQLNDAEAWADITISTQIDRAKLPESVCRDPRFLNALANRVSRLEEEAGGKLDIWLYLLWLAYADNKTVRGQWTEIARKEALLMLSKDVANGCPFWLLQRLIQDAALDDLQSAKQVKQRAYAIAVKWLERNYSQNVTQLKPEKDKLLDDYLNWIVESLDADLLVGLDNGISDPITKLVCYGEIWSQLRPAESEESNPWKWTRRGSGQRVMRAGSAWEATQRKGHVPDARTVFEPKLVELWKKAVEKALSSSDGGPGASSPTDDNVWLACTNTFVEVALLHPELREIALKMYHLLLNREWTKYFKSSGSTKEACLSQIIKLTQKCLNSAHVARKDRHDIKKQLHESLKTTKPAEVSLEELLNDLGKSVEQVQSWARENPKDVINVIKEVIEWIRELADREARTARQQAIYEIVSGYRPLFTDSKRDALIHLDNSDQAEVLRLLQADVNFSANSSLILKQMKQDQSALIKLIDLVETWTTRPRGGQRI